MISYRKIFFHALILMILVIPIFTIHARISPAPGGGGGGGEKVEITNPLKGNKTLIEFFNTILDKIIIPIGAILALIFIIYSGYLFVTAGGDETKITTAKTNLLYVVIGAAIILGAKVIAVGIQNTVESLQTTP